MSYPAHMQIRSGWLFSKQLDLSILFLPLFLAIGFWLVFHLYGMGQSTFLAFVILQGLGLGPFHQGVTWFYFFDPDLRQHFVGNRAALVKVTVLFILILAASIVGMMTVPTVVYFIFVLWTIQHIVQQNVGILLLYHNHDGKEAIVNRDLEISTIHRAAWLWMLIFFSRLAPAGTLIQVCAWLVVMFASIDLCILLFRYLLELSKLLRSDLVLNVPAQIFWLGSLMFFFPLALISDYNEALLIPLVMHWLQYIGLNLILTQRKYEKMVAGFSKIAPRSVVLYCGCAFVALFVLAGLAAGSPGHCSFTAHNAFVGLILGIGMLHYLQDAHLWRFKNPVIRKSLLPYLKG